MNRFESTELFKEIKIQEISGVKLLEKTPCYESKWEISVKVENDKISRRGSFRDHGNIELSQGKAVITLTRLNTQEQEKMEALVAKCETVADICKLYFEVYYD
jgi:hypothetical protein